MEADCPVCDSELRVRAPNFRKNLKQRDIDDIKDRFVCESCEQTFSRDEVRVREEGNGVI